MCRIGAQFELAFKGSHRWRWRSGGVVSEYDHLTAPHRLNVVHDHHHYDQDGCRCPSSSSSVSRLLIPVEDG